MINELFYSQSVIAGYATGILLTIIIIIVLLNFKDFKSMKYYQLIIFLTSFTIAVGGHGLLHYNFEEKGLRLYEQQFKNLYNFIYKRI